MEIEPSQIVSVLGGGSAGALILWFFQRYIASNDRKNNQVDDHKTELATIRVNLEQIRDTVNRIEASVERLEDRREKLQEEFFKLKSSQDAAWRILDQLRDARDV